MKPTYKNLEAALRMAVARFLRHGRCNCAELKCPQRNSPSCIGKIRTCEKSHISHFIKASKEKKV